MHIDTTYRRAYNIEPNMCWECYSCVKACPQNAIDCRGYADFAPMGHSVRALGEEAKGTISWKIKFRDGDEKDFVSPIRTTPWGSIKSPADYERAQPGRDEVPGTRARAGRAQHRGGCLRLEAGSTQAGSGLVGLFSRRKKTVFVDSDILVVGGGMAGCGATYESRYWGRDLKVVCVEKANIERSGAVAQGLYAINCYMGMQWDENQPEDHVRYARNDLMGLVREDLGYDIARHVDSTVHKFEEWGLPIMKDPETGRYQREGKWQIMIHGESYKPIVAEAARKAADRGLQPDHGDPPADGPHQAEPGRRGRRFQRPQRGVLRLPRQGRDRLQPAALRTSSSPGRWAKAWDGPGTRPGAAPPPMRLPILVGAKMTQMENRIVLTRFKDGYGPVGAYFLHLKTYTENAYGEEYESKWYDQTKALVGDYIDHATRCRPACATTPSWKRSRPAGAPSAW